MKGLEERLRKLREARGLSQIELSNELKLADSIIATYELGKKEPSLYHLTLIADYFNVSIDYLLGRDEEIYKKNLHKPLDKLLETYSFYLDGKPATKEEIIDAIAFIKAKREIRKEL
jgi:transcriptional regulator with XRE-family HTH domain